MHTPSRAQQAGAEDSITGGHGGLRRGDGTTDTEDRGWQAASPSLGV